MLTIRDSFCEETNTEGMRKSWSAFGTVATQERQPMHSLASLDDEPPSPGVEAFPSLPFSSLNEESAVDGRGSASPNGRRSTVLESASFFNKTNDDISASRLKKNSTRFFRTSSAPEMVTQNGQKSPTRSLLSTRSSSLGSSRQSNLSVRFSIDTQTFEMHSKEEYSREIEAPWRTMTKGMRIKVSMELNTFKKQEMQVHRSSINNTQLHSV